MSRFHANRQRKQWLDSTTASFCQGLRGEVMRMGVNRIPQSPVLLASFLYLLSMHSLRPPWGVDRVRLRQPALVLPQQTVKYSQRLLHRVDLRANTNGQKPGPSWSTPVYLIFKCVKYIEVPSAQLVLRMMSDVCFALLFPAPEVPAAQVGKIVLILSWKEKTTAVFVGILCAKCEESLLLLSVQFRQYLLILDIASFLSSWASVLNSSASCFLLVDDVMQHVVVPCPG